MPAITRETLDTGLRLLTESVTHVRSVTVGVWLTRGSRHEPADHVGIAHFVEHMLFKGTTSRSAEDIAQAVDSIGGQLDAFTAKEYAAYYVKVLDEHLPIALDILSDIVLHPALDAADVEREKKVVLEEIKMVEDTPDDLVHENLRAEPLGGAPVGPADPRDARIGGRPHAGGARRLLRRRLHPRPLHRLGRRAARPRAFPGPGGRAVRRAVAVRCGGPGVGPVRDEAGRRPEQEPRAEPRVPGRQRLRARAPGSARLLRAQHAARRIDELAPVPEHPREAGPGLRDLQRTGRLPRRRLADGLRRLRDRGRRRVDRPGRGGAERREAGPGAGRQNCGGRRTT